MDARPCYALILLGTSPGIVTELIWWLLTVDRRRLLGVEVWTTGSDQVSEGRSGYRSFQEALSEGGGWGVLRDSLGAASASVPELVGWPRWPDSLPDGPITDQLSVVLFGSRASQLTDIRTPADARTVAAQLHDRVRVLRRTLPDDVELVGSLAGGRKTMSASLYGAFSLQARPQDRLLHMLLHPEVEALTKGGSQFFAPTEALREQTGLAFERQLEAYEVGFPLVGELAGDKALRQVLDTHAHEGIWPALRANRRMEERCTALLRPEVSPRTDRWRLEITRPDEAEPFVVVDGITGSEAETYHAIANHPEGVEDKVWWGWLRGQGEGWKWSQGHSWEKDGADIARSRRAALAKRLAELTLEGLPSFCVQSDGGRPARYRLPACDRVAFEVPETWWHQQ